jgi:hypothetical protein
VSSSSSVFPLVFCDVLRCCCRVERLPRDWHPGLFHLRLPAPPTRTPLARFDQVGCLFVSAIARDGLVYRYPRITLGARLLELDGHCLLSSSREFVAGIIEDCHERNAPVKMVLQIVDRMQARTNFLPSRSHART